MTGVLMDMNVDWKKYTYIIYTHSKKLITAKNALTLSLFL